MNAGRNNATRFHVNDQTQIAGHSLQIVPEIVFARINKQLRKKGRRFVAPHRQEIYLYYVCACEYALNSFLMEVESYWLCFLVC